MDELFRFSDHSSNVALIDGDTGKKLTYTELQIAVESATKKLQKEKQLILLFCNNTIASIIEYLAALYMGHAVCLLDAQIKEELKQKFLKHYQHSGKLLIHPELQLLLSTSGTTGSPKLIRLSRKNIISNAKSIHSYLNITENERAVASLPIHYSYGLSVLHSHLLAGASIVLTQKSVLQKEFWDLFNREKCTSFAGVPYTYQMLNRIGFEKFSLPTLKTMTQAGGRLDKELINKFHKIMTQKNGNFFVMYGQTEATARIAYLPPELLPEKAGAIGKAIPGGSLKIYNDETEITKSHVLGELVYHGDNVMMGYADGPNDLKKGDELNGILRTGDLAYFDDEGIFYLSGRIKRISKVYGLRINLDEIESHLRIYGPVAVRSDDQKISLFFEGKTHPECITMLSNIYNLHPTTFVCHQVEALPLTPNGKIDYQRLGTP